MKRPTQLDVAQMAGVSRATVSFVLNDVTNGNISISDETRKRVWDAIGELGYVPDARARALRSGDTKTLGLIVPDIRNPHFWEIAEGVEKEARDEGYHLLVSNIALKHEYADAIFTDLSHRRIDGLMLMGSFIIASEEAQASLNQFFKQHLPIVELSDHYSVHYEVDRVLSDYYAATSEAMSYLLSLNHRRIGLLFGAAMPELAEDRYQSYRESLLAAGLPIEEDLIVRCGPTIEDGYQGTFRLLELVERPTAIIAINDLLAIGAIRAISDAGLCIPEDISLIGYDDISMAKYLVPRLTTVSKDVATLGCTAVKLLISRLQEPNRAYQTVKTSSRFIIRESTGPAPATI
ncbi:MAG: LacI family DNA-binding transcriptional regulator [Anaerolineae bacterium]|nr:LacI family DNA-binding transcriptional regulator [Anaerolineae bacterium]